MAEQVMWRLVDLAACRADRVRRARYHVGLWHRLAVWPPPLRRRTPSKLAHGTRQIHAILRLAPCSALPDTVGVPSHTHALPPRRSPRPSKTAATQLALRSRSDLGSFSTSESGHPPRTNPCQFHKEYEDMITA
eukprot:1072281-Rhodomonas_salina.4